MASNGLVTFKGGSALFPHLVMDYALMYQWLLYQSLHSVPQVAAIQKSILIDLVKQAKSPSLPEAKQTTINMHVLDAHNQYLLTLLAFAQAMAVEDSKTGVRLLRLRDQVENWQQMKPVLFDLLEQIMRTHVEFKMPPNLHPLALQYASDSPDVLLRLLIERKRNSWISTMALVRWTDYSPNIATEELAMREIVDRPMD